jgi:hypothetical protein
MNPIRNFVDKDRVWGADDDPTSPTTALERWLNDNIPVAGETFRSSSASCTSATSWCAAVCPAAGSRLRRITRPLLLTAKNDHWWRRRRPVRRTPDRARTSMGMSAGHVGLVAGAGARRLPEVMRWTAGVHLCCDVGGHADVRTGATPAAERPRRPGRGSAERIQPVWWANRP